MLPPFCIGSVGTFARMVFGAALVSSFDTLWMSRVVPSGAGLFGCSEFTCRGFEDDRDLDPKKDFASAWFPTHPRVASTKTLLTEQGSDMDPKRRFQPRPCGNRWGGPTASPEFRSEVNWPAREVQWRLHVGIQLENGRPKVRDRWGSWSIQIECRSGIGRHRADQWKSPG